MKKREVNKRVMWQRPQPNRRNWFAQRRCCEHVFLALGITIAAIMPKLEYILIRLFQSQTIYDWFHCALCLGKKNDICSKDQRALVLGDH